VAALVAICAVFGLLVGSFLNVVIYRVPRKESIVRPRSRCPECGYQLSAADNVPVVSWVVLKGRCRNCHTGISARYPLIELATGALFAAAGARLGFDAALPGFLLLFAALLAISAIDLERFIVPNRIVYPALFASVPIALIAAAADHDLRSLVEAVAGAALAWLILLAIHLVSPRGMGFGDVRLAALIGFWLGWLSLPTVLLGLFLSFLLASLVGVGLIASGLRTRKDRIPFGPFLAAGAVLATLVGAPLLRWYRPS
jgi:leader peptidase (prepilin peptidase)/N-methyltransferase